MVYFWNVSRWKTMHLLKIYNKLYKSFESKHILVNILYKYDNLC